jgi:metal-responsive CopG/Arc/MetJ family transcriptional regulator
MKIKIGTQLEEEVYQDLKVAAAREKRAINEVIQEAIAAYLQQQTQPRGKKSGLALLLVADPLRLTQEQFRESMEADFFDQ